MKITVAGRLGSGKSTVSKLLANELNIPYFSTGSMQRAMAEKANLTTLELNKQSELDAAVDHTIDTSTKELDQSEPNFIVDSRMAWHFVKQSFKLYLYVDPVISSVRIFHDTERTGEKHTSVNETYISTLEREQSEITRFQQLYGVNITDFNNYDAVIDTSFLPIDQIAPFILALLSSWNEGNQTNKIWLSPKLLYPTQTIDHEHLNVNEFTSNMLPQELIAYPNAVSAIRDQNSFYIYDKHAQAAKAIQQHIAVIPCILPFFNHPDISGMDKQQFIESHCTLNTIQSWEHILNFQFHQYPSHLQHD